MQTSMQTRAVRVFDTTLRDGEQAAGASMSVEDKVGIATRLDSLGVATIEAGYPAASSTDWAAVRKISETVQHARVCAFARSTRNDIDRAAEAVAPARRPGIQIVTPISDLHIEAKLRITHDDLLAMIRESVHHASELVEHVHWIGEDGSRSDFDFMAQCFAAALDGGAKTVVLADTVGYATPDDVGRRLGFLQETVAQLDGAELGIHCHDDLGLATVNSLAALDAGATEIQCTVNGLGERAGNAALEEIVMAIATRPDRYPFDTGVDTRLLTEVSRGVEAAAGISVAANKAIVGRNAFSHGSGIHQDGILKAEATYEIIDPGRVGAGRSLPIGRHSGRAGLRFHLKKIGVEVHDAALDVIFGRMKDALASRTHLTDAELKELAAACMDGDGGDLRKGSVGQS